MVMPGDNVKLGVKLIAPIAMDPGLRFAIREGGSTVGAGVVSSISTSSRQRTARIVCFERFEFLVAPDRSSRESQFSRRFLASCLWLFRTGQGQGNEE